MVQVVPDPGAIAMPHLCAAIGLVRVAASEQPHSSWSLTAQSALAPGTAAVQPSADAFGVATRSGLQHAARLEALQAPTGQKPASSSAAVQTSSTFVVSGGLGGVGLLASTWLAQLNPASNLMLLGRSGRAAAAAAAGLLPKLCSGPSCVTLLRCDVTAAAEAGLAAAGRGSMLILHAGVQRWPC